MNGNEEEAKEAPQVFGIPNGLSLRGAIQAIFNFYSNSIKEGAKSEDASSEVEHALDGSNFVRMCRDAPELGPNSTRIQRYELDLIFSKAKRPGRRKLLFDDFLQALLELAVVLYPDEDPTTAMTLLLVKHILGLFDQQPVLVGGEAFESVQKELVAF